LKLVLGGEISDVNNGRKKKS